MALGAAAPPSAAERFGRAMVDRAADGASLALPRCGSPRRALLGLPAAARGGVRTLAHTVLPPAPGSPLNRRGLGRTATTCASRARSTDLRTVRRHLGGTPNDVMLAAAAGALRAYQLRRGDPPQALKAMVPADVRGTDDADSGNRISFLFIELPCDESDPVARLEAVRRATDQRRRDREAEDLDAAFRVLALAPRQLQRTLAHAFAHPRLFNLVVSTVAGPATARYLHGCKLRSIHSAVPLADRHALSIGVLMVAGRACFGLLADTATLPDADALAGDLDAAMDELLAAAA